MECIAETKCVRKAIMSGVSLFVGSDVFQYEQVFDLN